MLWNQSKVSLKMKLLHTHTPNAECRKRNEIILFAIWNILKGINRNKNTRKHCKRQGRKCFVEMAFWNKKWISSTAIESNYSKMYMQFHFTLERWTVNFSFRNFDLVIIHRPWIMESLKYMNFANAWNTEDDII